LYKLANPHPFLRSFGAATVLFVIAALVVSATAGLTSYGAGRLFGSVVLIPAVVTGFIVRSRRSYWGWWKLALTVAGLAILLSGLAAIGNAGRTESPSGSPRLADLASGRVAVKEAARAQTAGIFTVAEVDCMVDLLERSDLTLEQIEQYYERPTPGPVEDAYAEIVPQCIDLAATVEPRPPTPEQRQQFATGLKSGAPELTDEQVKCVVDALFAGGVTVRQATLAGYIDSEVEKITPAVEQAFTRCVPA
jgi:hypothetical protein